MLSCRTVAFSFALATLVASLPAAADPPPPGSVVVVVVPSPTAPLPVAPLPVARAAPLPLAQPPAGWSPAPPAPYYAPPAAYDDGPYLEAHRTERRSLAAVAVGGVLTGGGAIFLVAGTVAITSACDGGDCGSNDGLATALVLAGVVGLAVGIPLIVYGSKRVPLGTATSSASPPAPLPAWAGAPAGRGWQWRF